MPACSTAIHPAGWTITFTEEDHSYRSVIGGREISYVSGTQFLGRYFPPFDPTGEITRRCALREGVTEEEMKDRWAAKGRESCRLGTRMHETVEDRLLARPRRNSPEDETERRRFEQAEGIAERIRARTDVVGVEKIVFSPALGIAGTVDALVRSRKDGTYCIVDHKSNAKIEEKDDNPYGKFCLAPIRHVPDTSFWHYALQLNLYEYLLRREKYVPAGARFRLFLNHVTAERARLIELPDMQTEVRELLIDWLASRLAPPSEVDPQPDLDP